MTWVGIVVAILMLAGLVGSAVPVLPGTPLIVAGALVYAVATDFTPIGIGRLVVLGLLAVAAAVLAHVAAALGVRGAGGSRWAMVGALVGAILGLAAAPAGLLLGPLLGAIAVELADSPAGRPACGRVSARWWVLVAGAVAHVALALVMVALFAWWVWRG